MKTTLFLILALLAVTVVPGVLAIDTGVGIGIDIEPEEFAPEIWMCDNRVIYDDCVESGRTSDCFGGGSPDVLAERINNYAFEGEQLKWKVLVMDKNKIEQIQEVVGTLGATQGTGNDIEVQCGRTDFQPTNLPETCNARLGEELLTNFDSDTMAFYECILTIETPDSMIPGEYWITIEAIGEDGEATMDENEFWYLNPDVALTVNGDLEFFDVRPGSIAYSSTLAVGNDASPGSGVLLDMFISGTDFYDLDASGAKCPTSNRLKLAHDGRSQANLGPGTNSGAQMGHACTIDTWINDPVGIGVDNNDHLCYFATSGAYSTAAGPRADAEGYVPIVYSDKFTRDFYNDAEIIQNGFTGGLDLAGLGCPGSGGCYHQGNVLTPGAEVSLTFKLGLPEPCVGNFNSGDVFFWGEAI
jgi:hypothetical protein